MRHLITIGILIVCHQGIQAQYSLEDTIPLREILITATPEKSHQLAGSVIQRIDTMTMMNSITSSFGELLAENTPVFIKNHGRGALSTISMRGTGSSHTTVLWNDIPINSPLTGQVDFSLLPVYLADELNVYFGASSMQNSQGALGGSIAMNNRPDWNRGFHLKLMQQLASFETYATYSQANWSRGSWSFRNRFFYETSENNYAYWYTAHRINESSGTRYMKGAAYSKAGYLGELFYRVNENNQVNFQVWHLNANRDIPALVGSSFYRHDENQKDNNLRMLASFKHYSDVFSYTIQTAYLSEKIRYYLINQSDSAADENETFNSLNQSQSSITQWNSELRQKNNWTFHFDAEFRSDWANTFDYKTTMGFTHRQNRLSTSISANKKVTEKLTFSGILKTQWITGQSLKPIPAISAQYAMGDKQKVTIKSTLSQNYHYPGLNDLYFVPGGNPDLVAEKGNSAEWALQHQIPFNHFVFEQSVNSYYSIIHNWIQWTPSDFGYWEPRNLKIVCTRGIEYFASLVYTQNSFTGKIRFHYAFTPSTNESDPTTEGDNSKGEQLIYVPRNSGGVAISAIYKDLEFTTMTTYLGQRNATTTSQSTFDIEPSYWLTNLSATLKLPFKEITSALQVKVENLWNSNYSNLKNRPMPLRNYSVLLKIEF